jgi:hypothetical protein
VHDSMDERPRYLVPALGGIYGALDTYSWPLVRAATGLFFVPHGLQKLLDHGKDSDEILTYCPAWLTGEGLSPNRVCTKPC